MYVQNLVQNFIIKDILKKKNVVHWISVRTFIVAVSCFGNLRVDKRVNSLKQVKYLLLQFDERLESSLANIITVPSEVLDV